MIPLNKGSRDFLKLLFTYDYIKLLKEMLRDEQVKSITLLEERDALLSELQKMNKADKEFKNEVRKTVYVKNILTLNASLRENNRKLRRNNNDLVGELVILKAELDKLKQT